MTELILTSFEKALESLEEVLQEPKTDIVRDSAIKRFEYTYELSVKMLRRYLEMSEDVAGSVDEVSSKDLIRLGAEKGCIEDPERWFQYREARNITSHAYDEEKADSIYAVLPAFAKDAQGLLEQLRRRASNV